MPPLRRWPLLFSRTQRFRAGLTCAAPPALRLLANPSWLCDCSADTLPMLAKAKASSPNSVEMKITRRKRSRLAAGDGAYDQEGFLS